MLSIYFFFALGMVCLLETFPLLSLRLTTFRNGIPYAERSNRASAVVTAVVAMLISKPGSGENESKFAKQLEPIREGGGTFDLGEKGKDRPFESKVNSALFFIPVEMNSFKVWNSREYGFGQDGKESQHMRTLKLNLDGNRSA